MQVRGTLVLLPLLYRCRPLGCVYLLAPWDIHASLSKAALQEMAALLAAGTFRALVCAGPLQQQWYSEILAEGSLPAQQEAAADSAAAGSSGLDDNQQQERKSDVSAPAAGQQVQQKQQQQGSDKATKRVARAVSWSPGAGNTDSSCITQGQPALRPSVSLDSLATAAAPAAASVDPEGRALGAGPAGSPKPCAAAEAAKAAAAVAPAGLAASGHACSEFPELVLWPEMLEIKEDLARSRHSVVSKEFFKYSCTVSSTVVRSSAWGIRV